jgi:small-conductance mechanosensitive channel
VKLQSFLTCFSNHDFSTVILVRRPYGIGDLIQVGGVETNGSLDGALPWMVVNVSLFETVVVYLPTNERASLSNGSLASSRIINWARSPQAQFHIFLNFPLDTPYEKIVVFKRAIEEYMKARPREWRALNGFRANRVYANQNYVEYIIVIQ